MGMTGSRLKQNMTRGVGFAVLVLTAVGLTGCESARDPQLLANPNYVSGHSDGCRTSNSRVAGFSDTVTHDDDLSRAEPAYEIGWRDGYVACGGMAAEDGGISGREIFGGGSEHYTSAPR